jgi:uncharacterized membrane protein YjjB (DUF3815 family)
VPDRAWNDPGSWVPLINGIRDAIGNSMEPSLARLAFAALVVVAIAFGLFVATRITGVRIPLSGSAPLLPIAEDALFSATATIGYVCLFNVPARLAWACMLRTRSRPSARAAVP